MMADLKTCEDLAAKTNAELIEIIAQLLKKLQEYEMKLAACRCS